MALIRIPDRIKPTFERLLALTEQTQESLVDYLISAPVGANTKAIIDSVVEDIEGNETDLKIAVSGLYTVYAALDVSELSKEKFVPDFIDALREASLEIKNPSHLSNLLHRLLSNQQNKELSDKLQMLVSEGQKLILDTRIITDIRPVVEDDDAERFQGIAVVHNLRIRYLENGGEKTDFFSLDKLDLEKIDAQVQRAIQKQTVFKEKFSGEDFPYMEVK